MKEELLEVAETVTKGNSYDVIVINGLRVLESKFLDVPIDYFKTNALKRIKQLRRSNKNSINEIFKYLLVLAFVEADMEISRDSIRAFQDDRYRSNNSDTRSSIKLSRQGLFGIVNYYFYSYLSSRLPYCCGVTEYGQFGFEKIIKVDQDLVYNLVLDLIKLSANGCRTSHSGAVGIINYFIDTPFMNILESRDDLEFVKEFKNPKTNHTLKMFTFNTKI